MYHYKYEHEASGLFKLVTLKALCNVSKTFLLTNYYYKLILLLETFIRFLLGPVQCAYHVATTHNSTKHVDKSILPPRWYDSFIV